MCIRDRTDSQAIRDVLLFPTMKSIGGVKAENGVSSKPSEAVSYTHLDVYKRQVSDRRCGRKYTVLCANDRMGKA